MVERVIITVSTGLALLRAVGRGTSACVASSEAARHRHTTQHGFVTCEEVQGTR